MISQTSFGSPQVDPNSLRAIEQISHVINDIEQRLQIVRVALAQSVPSLPFGPTSPLVGLNAQNPWALVQNTGSFPGTPINPLAIQQLQQLQHLQQLMALSPLASGLYTGVPSSVPMGIPTGFPSGFPGLGVASPFGTPFGATTGFGVPTNPFRF